MKGRGDTKKKGRPPISGENKNRHADRHSDLAVRNKEDRHSDLAAAARKKEDRHTDPHKDRHSNIDGKRNKVTRGNERAATAEFLTTTQENRESDNSKNPDHCQNFFDPVAIPTIEQLKSFDHSLERARMAWLERTGLFEDRTIDYLCHDLRRLKTEDPNHVLFSDGITYEKLWY